MILKTILIFLIGLLGYSEWLLGTSCLQRPIVLGPLVGLVMGNLPAGIYYGCNYGTCTCRSRIDRCI